MDNLSSHKDRSNKGNNGLNEEDPINQADNSLVASPPPNSKESRSVALLLPSPSSHVTPISSISPHRNSLFPLDNAGGASSSSPYAKTPIQKVSGQQEDQTSHFAVAKAANIMLNLTEEMVPTPYKRS